MGQNFKETAHLKNDPKKLADNWTHVYDRKNCECEECKPRVVLSLELLDEANKILEEAEKHQPLRIFHSK